VRVNKIKEQNGLKQSNNDSDKGRSYKRGHAKQHDRFWIGKDAGSLFENISRGLNKAIICYGITVTGEKPTLESGWCKFPLITNLVQRGTLALGKIV
jgi:hypothetical protein